MQSPVKLYTPQAQRRRENEGHSDRFPIPDSFCNVDRVQFENEIYSGQDILFIPLKDVLNLYFQENKLLKLGELMCLLSQKRKDNKISSTIDNSPTHMFFVCIGTKAAYDKALSVPVNKRSLHGKNFYTKYSSYKILFINFFKGLFKNSEEDVLEKTYERSDVLTISIFARSSAMNKSTGKVTYTDYLFAAASFIIDQEPSCLLNWLGVLKKVPDNFNRPKTLKKSEFDN